MKADGFKAMGMIEKELEAWARDALRVYDYMDLEVISVTNGVYQCFVPLNRNTGNHVNTVHAAFQWAAAEVLGGLIVLSNRPEDKYVPVVRSMSIEFQRPALSGITSEAMFPDRRVEAMIASLESTGRHDFELCSVVRDADGEVVAETTGRYAVRTREPAG